MPSLGADMDAGTLLEWYVKPGDTVKRGDLVAVVDTSKAEIEVEIFEDGVIDELLVEAGTRVPVGTVLATVRPVGERAPATVPAVAEPEAATPPAAAQAEVTAPPAAVPPSAEREAPVPVTVAQGHRLRVSPLARRAAEELGVDLSAVSGSGPRGAITRADVERAAERTALTPPAAAPSPPLPVSGPAAAVPPSGPAAPAPRTGLAPDAATLNRQAAMRAAIGALMARSKREIPHYYLELQIEISRALDWLHETNLQRPVNERLLPSILLLSAVARAATEMPEMNGFWVDDAWQPATGVHLGVAISLRGGGLIAPALHDADQKSLEEIMAGVRDLVQRARTGRLRNTEMSDPTITVTNLGERGVDLVHGVIYPPQVALVGFGGIRERPWAVDGMIGVRPVVTATLAADHRAGDGHAGSRFLTLIEQQLQHPEQL